MQTSRQAFALKCVAIGLLLGLAGNFLFYGQVIGISFPIFIGLSLAGLFGTAYTAQIQLNRRNLWLCAPILFFAAMLVFRANLLLALINICTVLGLGGLLLHYLTAKERLDTEPLPLMLTGASGAALRSVTDTGAELMDAWRYLRANRLQQREGVTAVLRGAIFTIPILLVFAALLGSADQVFGKYLDQMWQLFSFDGVDALLARTVLIVGLAWLGIGGLSYALARRMYFVPTSSPAEDQPPTQVEKRKPSPITLTMIETTMILGAVNLLFGTFVVIQFAYLFGGQAAIGDQGFTFSEYARRGFYELLAVTVLSLGMALLLDWMTIRRGSREQMLFKGLSIALSALVGVMIVSASQRMALYEQAYGFTDDRVFAHLFILWLGGLFVAFVLHLLGVRKNVFAFGALLVAIGYTVNLNLMNIDLYIAEQNIARYHEGEELDVCYLNTLSVDALPALLTLRAGTRENDPELYDLVNLWLVNKWTEQRILRPYTTLFSFNTARESASTTLDDLSETVQAEVAQIESWSSCYSYSIR